MLRHVLGTDTRFHAFRNLDCRAHRALVTLYLQSTRTLSVTIAGLGFRIFLVCPDRALSGVVVVSFGGQAGDQVDF
jgi:hypothetical protein